MDCQQYVSFHRLSLSNAALASLNCCFSANILRRNRSASSLLAMAWYGDKKCLENDFRAATPVTYQIQIYT